MQYEIKLTNESSNTVFVDDVDVSKGVYAKHAIHNHILFIGKRGCEYKTSAPNYDNRFEDVISADSLLELITYASKYFFYTIPDNKRIVTEREVTIDDLKNTDHVGFVDSLDNKGFVVCIGGNEGLFSPVKAYKHGSYGDPSGNTHKEIGKAALVENSCSGAATKKIIRFTTRKELYQWLAE